MKLNDLQNELDIKKYTDSQKANKDMCGTYDHCGKCSKKNKYPCASAYKKYYKVK